MRTRTLWISSITVLATLLLLAGCGSTPSAPGGGGGTPPPAGGGSTGDTSGYAGRLAWSASSALSVPAFRVWDLASSRFTASRDASSSTLQSLPGAALSPDGTRAAYTLIENTPFDRSYDEHVVVIDAADGSVVGEATVTAPSADTEVYTRNASLADDGTVALQLRSVSYDPSTGAPDTGSDVDIALWTPGGGEPAAIPGANSSTDDRCPRISADGGTVTFVSERDGVVDFYRVPAAGGSVTRLSYTAEASITQVEPGLFGCPFQLSDDGGTLAFVGNTAGGDRAFAMDTATGSIMPLDAGVQGTLRPTSLALSGDGTRAAFVTMEPVASGNDLRYRLYGVSVHAGATPTVIVSDLLTDMQRFDVGESSATSLALSRDGRSLAYVGIDPTADQGFLGLFVRRFDGSDPRLVTNDDADLMLGMLDITF